jgi:hypothetical protein
MASGKWTPLEPKPETMNDFLREVGVKSGWYMRCIHGLDSIRVGLTIPDQTKAAAFVFAYECSNNEVDADGGDDAGNSEVKAYQE